MAEEKRKEAEEKKKTQEDEKSKLLPNEERKRLIAMCGRVFNPSAPVNKFRLFAGRIPQLKKIADAINNRGRHAIMYGDRGVGKTSLANILPEAWESTEGMKVVKVNCAEADNYFNVWRKALSEITVLKENYVKHDDDKSPVELTLDVMMDKFQHVGPGEIRQIIQQHSSENFELVFVFDEFDKLPEPDRHLFADTIKDLSDNSVSATLVLVGVANDVVQLIEEHASIDRCLVQILMPSMDLFELQEILDKALTALGLSMEDKASKLIVSLSQGLPHYTHLLGQESAIHAVTDGRKKITQHDVSAAIKEAMSNSQHTVANDYLRASQGQRVGTLYPKVLLACALADVDELGYFSSGDIREPLRQITQEDYDIPGYSKHLHDFSIDESRGPVLEKRGKARRFRFRFRNPLLRPFIIIKALAEGTLNNELLDYLTTNKSKRNEVTLF